MKLDVMRGQKPRGIRWATRVAMPLAAVAALVAAQLVLATPASAVTPGTTVKKLLGVVLVDARPGKANNIVVTTVGGETTVRDIGDVVDAKFPCTQVDDHAAKCLAVTDIVVNTFDLGDLVTAQVPQRMIVDAGTGSDLVFTGAGNDFLFGGDGSDILNGGAGNDTLDCGNDFDLGDGGLGLLDTAVGCELALNVP
jgi:hemolysin type calcium-binding protein